MGYMYSFLDKMACEQQSDYEYRIAKTLPFVCGRVFFDMRNYDVRTGEFSVYIEWDDELNGKLAYPLPSGGYFVKATFSQACGLHEVGCGLPVYMKPVWHQGGIHPYRTYIMYSGRPFSLEFDGSVLIPFEDRYEELGCKAACSANTTKSESSGGSQRHTLAGSQGSSQRYVLAGSQGGSQRYVSAGSQGGSQRYVSAGSQGGSQRYMLAGSQGYWEKYLERYLSGSQNRYSVGSQNRYLVGSQRYWQMYLERYLGGSQSRYLGGSQGYWQTYLERYLRGSRSRYLGGSQRYWQTYLERYLRGSQSRYLGESQKCLQDRIFAEHQTYTVSIPQEWQLICRGRRPERRIGGNAKLGYGIDLI